MKSSVISSKIIKVKRTTLNITTTGQGINGHADFSHGDISGYIAIGSLVDNVGGSGSGNVLMSIHGINGGSVYATGNGSALNLTFDIVTIYVKTEFVDLITSP